MRFSVQEITLPVMVGALEIKAKRRLSAATVSAAGMLGCREILSEDMAHGLEVDGVVILNPFRDLTAP